MRKKILSFVFVFGFSIVVQARKLEFYYQPHESAGVDCTYKEIPEMKDFLVKCGGSEYLVHFLARPYKKQDRVSWEVLYWVVNQKAGGSLMMDLGPSSEMKSFQVGQFVDNDTAELILRVK